MKSLPAVAAVSAPVSAWAAETPSEPYTWRHPMMWGAGLYGMIFGPLFMILMLAVVIAVAVPIVRSLGGPWYGAAPPHYPPLGRTPLDILKERFARGEIDKNEFEDHSLTSSWRIPLWTRFSS
jgi:putative membrane protein